MRKILSLSIPVLVILAAALFAGVMLTTPPAGPWRVMGQWAVIVLAILAGAWGAYLSILIVKLASGLEDLRKDREDLLKMVESQDGRLRNLRAQVELLTAMRELSRVSADADETRFDEILRQLVQIVEGITRAEEAAIFLSEDGSDPVPAVYVSRGEVTTSGYRISEVVDPGIIQAAWRDRVVRRGGDEEFMTLATPMVADDEVIGILYVGIALEGPARERAREAERMEGDIRDISQHLALTLNNAYLARLAVRDRLTNLYNRNQLLEDLSEQLTGGRRRGGGCSLLMIDIDFFKKVNDKRGHLAGDEVLKAVGELLSGSVRRGEMAYRYGGEEFAILLPRAGVREALILAERIRNRTSQMETKVGRYRIKVTLSVGVATADERVKVPEDLIALADAALYRAKEGGRNRVEVH